MSRLTDPFNASWHRDVEKETVLLAPYHASWLSRAATEDKDGGRDSVELSPMWKRQARRGVVSLGEVRGWEEAISRALGSRKPPSLFTGDEGVWHLKSEAEGRAADCGKKHHDMLRLLELRTLSETTGPADQVQACVVARWFTTASTCEGRREASHAGLRQVGQEPESGTCRCGTPALAFSGDGLFASAGLQFSWGDSCAWQRVARLGSSKSDGKVGRRRSLLLDATVSRRRQAKIGSSSYKSHKSHHQRYEDEDDDHLGRSSTRSRVGPFCMRCKVAGDIVGIPLEAST
ncbi:hypothetical protein CSAL01_09840 [Colletotrichum salicis]|uniref:Uncharacterized protein n=1 Tax=Colletotrichum salicis TaxID=1209931 RepID=A0A135V3L3_9PEZI|nr:hypothetical protein CSAL01_09840 [Colletotrichum salicis]